MSLVLALTTAILFSLGTWLLLQRRLTRIVIGLGLIGHGANLLLLQTGERRGVAPFVGSMAGKTVADPMPQALALTGDDLVEDDLDDRRIAAALELELDDEELADQRIQTASEAAADAGGMGSNGEGGR